MRAKSIFAALGIVAAGLATTVVHAHEDVMRGKANEVIKSQPTTAENAAPKSYRPKRGCFAAGTRDTSGNAQVVC